MVPKAKKAWKHAALFSVLASLPLLSLGSIWFDPDFEAMVDGADLIAVVEITKGGMFSCRARVREVLKGAAPLDEIVIGGFNNRQWPESGIERETLAAGEQLLMFLRQVREATNAHPLLLLYHRQEGSPQWTTPSPSTGDFRISNGKIRGGWLDVSYPHSKPEVDAGTVIELVRGYVLHKAGQRPEKAQNLIASFLTVPKVQQVTAEQIDENREKAWLFQWVLCAQAAYGQKRNSNAIFAATRSKNDLLKICAARGLPSVGSTPEVFEAVSRLLTETNSFVQAEACHVLIRSEFKAAQVVPVLLKALPRSDPRGSGPGNLMEPLWNRRASGREMIISALTHFGAAAEAENELVKLIPSIFVKSRQGGGFEEPREFLNAAVFGALADHFLKFPSPQAREGFIRYYSKADEFEIDYFHQYFFRDGNREYLAAVMRRVLFGARLPLGTPSILVGLARKLPPGDRQFEESVFRLLQRFNGAEEARDILPAAIPAASDRIQELLQQYRTERLRKSVNGINEIGWEESWKQVFDMSKRGVDLKLSSTYEPGERLGRWVDLLQEDKRLGYVTDYVLVEIVRSTPANMRNAAVNELRRIGSESSDSQQGAILQAMKELGGSLSDEEQKTVKTFKRINY